MSRIWARGGLVVGVALAAMASGCTLSTTPAPTRAQAPPPPPAVAPAPYVDVQPRAERPYMDPELRRAVDAFGQEVRAIRFAPEARQHDAIRNAIHRLADAIERLPHARRDSEIRMSARRIREDAARVGFEGPSPRQADSRAVRDALDESAEVLGQLARGRFYRNAAGVDAEVYELRRRVEAVRPFTPLRRQDAEITAALGSAHNVLVRMVQGLERGEVYY